MNFSQEAQAANLRVLPEVVSQLKAHIPQVCKDNLEFRDALLTSVDSYASKGDFQGLKMLLSLERYPVDMPTFLFSPDFLARPKEELYPEVVRELSLINNPGGERLNTPYVEAVFTGGIGCVSADTEYLSLTGWKKISEYDGGTVAQWQEGVATWHQPEYHVYPETHLWHFHTKYGIDQMVSSEHRMLYRSPKSGKLGVCTAEQIATQHNASVKGFSGKFLTTFEVGGELVDPKLLRVQVMVCADGWICNKENGLCYLNLKKQRKIGRARELLLASGLEYKEFKKTSLGFVRFSFYSPWNTKRLSDFGWGLGSQSLQLIAEECLHWDGHKTSYFTTLKEEADFMSYAGAASGFRTVVQYDARALAPHWIVRLNPNLEITLQGVPTKTPVVRVPTTDGKKYCFTVPSGFFIARRNGKIFITGNSAKTTSALYTVAYQLYLLSCFKDPHKTFNMDSTSEILFIFQSMGGGLAEDVDYGRFREICAQSRYFVRDFPFKGILKSELHFPSRIQVKPIGSDGGAIGQNVIGGAVDELNFMANVQNSKRSADGGNYNQAMVIYNSIARRRMTRFMSGARMPGILCLISSKRYPGEFTDIKLAEAKTNPRIYVYDKRVWDIKPPGTYGPGRFRVFHGDMFRKAAILGDSAVVAESDQHLITEVPLEFISSFESDLVGAMRDIAGIATLSRYPFFQNVAAVSSSFGKMESVLSAEETDFVSTPLLLYPKAFKDVQFPRWCHIDLGLSSDSAGIACGYVPKFLESDDESGLQPQICFDFLLKVRPPLGGEIIFSKIRKLLVTLRNLGLPIRWVSFDSYQSADSIQILRQLGFSTGRQSMDIGPLPYSVTKTAMYSGRVLAPTHLWCLKEFISLEKDAKTGKIDHPPTGSKDVSDAVAGVCYGLTTRRDIWSEAGISFNSTYSSSKEVKVEVNAEI